MGNLIFNISNMASIVLYPRFQEKYGLNDDKREVYAIMMKILKYIWFPLIFVILGGVFVLPVLVKLIIPNYIGGIQAMKIFICGTYFLSLAIFCNNFIVTIDKQVFSVIVCGAIIAVNLALNLIFLGFGWGIEGVALATSVSYVMYFILLFAASKRLVTA